MSLWHLKNFQDNLYALQYSLSNNSCTVMIFDMQIIWSETLSHEAFLDRCKDYNPMMEFTAESMGSLIPTILNSLVANNPDDHINLHCIDDVRLLEVETPLGGVPFKFAFKLMSPQTNYLLYKEVTAPLLALVDTLLKKDRMLVEMLKKKDVEINEYKAQGVSISRKNVVTRPFEDSSLQQTEFEDPIVTFTTASSIFPHLQKSASEQK